MGSEDVRKVVAAGPGSGGHGRDERTGEWSETLTFRKRPGRKDLHTREVC